MKGIKRTYFGGKGGAGTYQRIINLIRPHDIYIDAFVGNSAILRYKALANTNIALDLDIETIALWKNHPLAERVTFRRQDAMEYLASLVDIPAQRQTCIYLDPPYLEETRTSNTRYSYDMLTPLEHADLLEICRKLAVKSNIDILISCYDHPVYQGILSDWNKTSFQSMTRGGLRRETVYYNYDTDGLLHDYRYAGNEKRERERIKRKIKRHVDKFRKLPETERNAIFSELVDLIPVQLRATKPATTDPQAPAADANYSGIGHNPLKLQTNDHHR